MAATVTTFSKAYRLAFDTQSFTGSVLDVDTTLALIANAQATVKATAVGGTTNALACTCNYGADGLLDIYSWDAAGSAAAAASNVMWMALGS